MLAGLLKSRPANSQAFTPIAQSTPVAEPVASTGMSRRRIIADSPVVKVSKKQRTNRYNFTP